MNINILLSLSRLELQYSVSRLSVMSVSLLPIEIESKFLGLAFEAF